MAVGFSNLMLSRNLAVLLSRREVYFTRDSQSDLLLGWVLALLLLSASAHLFLLAYAKWPRLRPIFWSLALPSTALALFEFARSIGLKPIVGAAVVAALIALACAPVGGRPGKRRAHPAIASAFRYGAVYALVCVCSALWAASHPYYAPSVDVPDRSDPHAPIVWVVFDELDQGWLFDHRVPEVDLPEFDALRKQSVMFSNAERPGPETIVSLPALLCGKPVVESHPLSESELLVHFVGSNPSSWATQDSVFDGMQSLGRSSSIVGFFHNYGSIFATKTSHVRSDGLVAYGIAAALEHEFWLLLPGAIRTPLLERLGDRSLWNQAMRAQHRLCLSDELSQTNQAIENWRSGFLFLHIGFPHYPWLNSPIDPSHTGYLSNLKVCDDFLGQIRADLERIGAWDSATILITADHNFRQPMMGVPLNHKVPLMVKLPGQTHGKESTSSVRAIDERWLLEAIASKRVQTPDQVISFMTSRSHLKR